MKNSINKERPTTQAVRETELLCLGYTSSLREPGLSNGFIFTRLQTWSRPPDVIAECHRRIAVFWKSSIASRSYLALYDRGYNFDHRNSNGRGIASPVSWLAGDCFPPWNPHGRNKNVVSGRGKAGVACRKRRNVQQGVISQLEVAS